MPRGREREEQKTEAATAQRQQTGVKAATARAMEEEREGREGREDIAERHTERGGSTLCLVFFSELSSTGTSKPALERRARFFHAPLECALLALLECETLL